MVRLLRLDAPTPATGTLAAGKRLVFKGKIRNALTRPLKLTNKSKTACLAVEVDAPADPFVTGGLAVLPPRAKYGLDVTFAPPPGASGRFKGTLSIQSSDPRRRRVSVKLTGRR